MAFISIPDFIKEMTISLSALQLDFIEDCFDDVVAQNKNLNAKMEVNIQPTYELLYLMFTNSPKAPQQLKNLAEIQHQRKMLKSFAGSL